MGKLSGRISKIIFLVLILSFGFFPVFQNCSSGLSTNSNQAYLANSQTLPTFKIINISFVAGQNVITTNFPRTNLVAAEVSSLEMPPVMLGSIGGINYSFISSFESYLCSTGLNVLSPNQFPSYSCRLTSTPVVDSSRRTYSFTTAQIAAEAPWKRNYSGVFSAHIIPYAGYSSSLVAITHYENKGEGGPYTGLGTGPFPNSIGPNMTNTVGTLASGNCMEANGCYFASVGLQWRPTGNILGGPISTASNDLYDYGPITWPSAGYTTPDGLTKISDGPRHPYSIIKDGFLYVFYIDYVYSNGADGNFPKYSIGDRQAGLKVIRAPIDNLAPSQWRAYFNGQFSEPTLPTGFSPQQMPSFASSQGPRATLVFGENSTSRISFAVAKIKGTRTFIGAETYIDYNKSQCPAPGMTKVALRTSEDLVNWSPRMDVYGCLDRNTFGLFYAKFLDSTGNTNYEIDPNDFYLIGNSSTSIDPNAAVSKNYSTSLNTLRLKLTQ